MPPSGTVRSVLPPVLLLAQVCLLACSSDLAGGPNPASSKPLETEPARVRVVRPIPVQDKDSYLSSLYVERDVGLTARSSGIIEKVLVDRGDRVKVGQPIAVLETDLATRELEIAEQALRLAEAEHERFRSLHDQKIASDHEFLRAEIARDQAASAFEFARAILERCTIRAPFDGIVVERWAVIGQRIVEDDDTVLFRLVAADPLRARVDVPEEKLFGLKKGGRALLTAAIDASFTQPARIVFVSPAIDAASGTAPVIVEAVSPAGALRLGASVNVRFDLPDEASFSLVRLPREIFAAKSLKPSTETTLLVVQDGRAAARQVRVVESRRDSVIVRGPLSPSDRVIAAVGIDLEEGDPVSTVEETP